jgi:hypothetical protein
MIGQVGARQRGCAPSRLGLGQRAPLRASTRGLGLRARADDGGGAPLASCTSASCASCLHLRLRGQLRLGFAAVEVASTAPPAPDRRS